MDQGQSREHDKNDTSGSDLSNASFTVAVLFQSKWRVQILSAMRSGPVRLGQLRRLFPEASKKVLTKNLRELEANGIVVRKDMSGLMLHIEYELDDNTKEGTCALLDHLAEWGRRHPGNSSGAAE